MGGNRRRGVIKVLGAAGLGAALLAFAAIGASAMIPKPGTIRIADGYTFKDLTGYQSPGPTAANCNAYAPNTAFSFQVSVTNGFGARDQKFNVQIFKMADLNPSTCYSEASLETMVQTGHNATETGVYGTDQAGNTQSYHFDYGTTNTVVGGTTLSCGYYQFDMGLPNTGSFAPRPGTGSSDTGPVSGFVLFNGPSCASTGGVSGGNTSGSTTNSGGVSASTTHLASTGAGPAPLAFLGLAMLGAIIVIGGVRLAYTGRRPE
ncbi:MAG TPA: hypothetical protein VFR68_01555 [Candidatus Dormibacteraeota bacterium]|nr:hypothetical protein [Candidatus Dormibacteraeota bacterium]